MRPMQLGGKYRARQPMTSKDSATVLKSRAEIVEAIYGDGDNVSANEYGPICTSHADDLWEIPRKMN